MCSHGWSKEKSTKTAFACSACRTTHFWFWWENEKKRPIIKRFSKGFSPCHSIRTAHLLPYRNESMQSQMKVRGVKTHPLLLVHLEINPFGITFNWKWPNIGKKLWKSFFLHSLIRKWFICYPWAPHSLESEPRHSHKNNHNKNAEQRSRHIHFPPISAHVKRLKFWRWRKRISGRSIE